MSNINLIDSFQEFKDFKKDPFFMAGLSLYWASGSKKGDHFQFSSSDKKMIAFMVLWIKKYLAIPNDLIKERVYGGYLRIVITRIDILRKIMAWQKLLVKYYDNV